MYPACPPPFFILRTLVQSTNMRQSTFFSKTLKHAPEGEETKNAKFLIRGGFISKASAGVYTLLPLGFRVLENINRVIREEMNTIGGEELLMPALIDKKYWEQSGRWGTDVIYRTGRTKLDAKTHDFEYGLGWTHEEVITSIARQFLQSYKDLPRAVYQIQNKFRAEVRAQGGLLRGREFLMKDLYSFHATVEDLNDYYERVKGAYTKIFDRLHLKTLIVEASGGAFTKEYTHEFQVLNLAGEDMVHYCTACGFAQNREVFDVARHTKCRDMLHEDKAIEVGNIFKLGTRFSESFGLRYTDQSGERKPVVMGSYGIGPTRTLGTIVEEYADDKGIMWPEAVAPFAVHLLQLGANDAVYKSADKLYASLQKQDIPVLYDDRKDVSAGEKFADADLIGIPYRAVVSEKTGDKIEIKKRTEIETKRVSEKELFALVRS